MSKDHAFVVVTDKVTYFRCNDGYSGSNPDSDIENVKQHLLNLGYGQIEIRDDRNNPVTAGDRLYKCFNGDLEICAFVEESVSAGAIIPTWLLKPIVTYCPDGAKRAGVSKNIFRTDRMCYSRSPREAYQRYLADCAAAIAPAERFVKEAVDQLVYIRGEVSRIETLLRLEAIAKLLDVKITALPLGKGD